MSKTYDITVDISGKGDVESIQQALDLAPLNSLPYTIFIQPGHYEEKLHITRPNTHLVGASKANTFICYTSANGLLANDGKIWATYNSYVVNADATDITFQSLTIENTFDFIGNQRKENTDSSKISATQAVALLVGHKGDKIQCRDCTLKSYQDTLYVSSGRSYFESTDIWGTVDFIFGGGTALFNHCELVCRWREDSSGHEPLGFVSAPSTLIEQKYGLVFYRCNLTKENEHVPNASYRLGRPWHPTTNFSDGSYANPNAIGHCAYIECQFDNHIHGWDKMHGKAKDGASIWFYAEDSRFHTFNNQPLAQYGGDHFEMSTDDKMNYSLKNIFSGWAPSLLAQDFN
ncbi:pectinesterase family protein [Vibrio ziniensis]|uniref:Pectinesterase n=1 Tax=Vibrio ziniensis TaxID=2711221 RepID=A0A6G7CQ06_9VIBR|nr:pectinesterase family protein [Vibrio ziniensis]QIH44098.1 pectinesterase A [Vibrio ziniensis]QOT69937.1 pectinesterase [Vibrio ziniensis]